MNTLPLQQMVANLQALRKEAASLPDTPPKRPSVKDELSAWMEVPCEMSEPDVTGIPPAGQNSNGSASADWMPDIAAPEKSEAPRLKVTGSGNGPELR